MHGQLPNIPDGCDLEEFKDRFFNFSNSFADFWVCETDIPGRGFTPTGVIVSKNGGDHPNIHALWFYWAKPRQIIEGAAKFLCLLRDEGSIGLMEHNLSKPEYTEFFTYLTDIGLIRRVGTMKHWNGADEHIRLYQMTRKL